MFSGLLMYMQVIGDGDWFSVNAFTPSGGGGRGMLGMNRGGGGRGGRGGNNAPTPATPPAPNANGNNTADNDQPTPVLIDPQRVAYTREVYGQKTEAQLTAEQTSLLNDAINAGRPIYALLTPSSATTFRERLAPEGFDCKVIAKWNELLGPETEADATNTPRPGGIGQFFGGGGGGGRGRGGPGGGGFGGPGGGGFGRFGPGNDRAAGALSPPSRGMRSESPQNLQVLQITRRPPTPPSTTQPTVAAKLTATTTKPATAPEEPATPPAELDNPPVP